MRAIIYLAIPFCCVFSQAQIVQKAVDPVDFVNPLMGTDSKPGLSNGNTYPAIALPWGMNFWVPQTKYMGNGWTYQYNADKIRGFKQTHQPSPWMNDYGQFCYYACYQEMQFTRIHGQAGSRIKRKYLIHIIIVFTWQMLM